MYTKLYKYQTFIECVNMYNHCTSHCLDYAAEKMIRKLEAISDFAKEIGLITVKEKEELHRYLSECYCKGKKLMFENPNDIDNKLP